MRTSHYLGCAITCLCLQMLPKLESHLVQDQGSSSSSLWQKEQQPSEWPAHCYQPKLVRKPTQYFISLPWGLFAGLGFLFLCEECGSSCSLDSILSSLRCLAGALSCTAPFSSCLCIAMDALIAAATARSSSWLQAKIKKIFKKFFFKLC